MIEFPPVRIDWHEKAIFWEPHRTEDGQIWAAPGTEPFKAYWHHIYFFHRMVKTARYWGFGTVEYDCQCFEHFGFWWFNVSWSTPGCYARAKKRELAANGTPTP